MIKNKCKKIVSAMLLIIMIATICNTNVFAGGDNSDGVSGICADMARGFFTGCIQACKEACCPDPIVPPKPVSPKEDDTNIPLVETVTFIPIDPFDNKHDELIEPLKKDEVVEPDYLFDADYYAAKYPDLKKAFGTDKAKLYNHWNEYGKAEGRSPCPFYDPVYYLNNNEDLKRAFGTDYTKLYNHFISHGINELRKSSSIYDGAYYKSHYSDLQKAYGNNSSSYLSHFVKYGMQEGRQASENFNVHDYKSKYGDLQKAYSDDLKRYYFHYMEYQKVGKE